MCDIQRVLRLVLQLSAASLNHGSAYRNRCIPLGDGFAAMYPREENNLLCKYITLPFNEHCLFIFFMSLGKIIKIQEVTNFSI